MLRKEASVVCRNKRCDIQRFPYDMRNAHVMKMRSQFQMASWMLIVGVVLVPIVYFSLWSVDHGRVRPVDRHFRFPLVRVPVLRSSISTRGNISQTVHSTATVKVLSKETVRASVRANYPTLKTTPSHTNATSSRDSEAVLSQNEVEKVYDGYRNAMSDQPLKMKCQDCALISSSGRILGQKKGSEIDKTDCVFRMNAAPVKGFETDVGQKTSARIAAFNAFGSKVLKEWKPGIKLIVWTNNHPGTIKRILSYAKTNKNADLYMSTKEHIQLMDKLFEEETKKPRMKSHTWLSTGWFTFDLLRHVCPSTKIYGMIPEDFCTKKNQPKARYHYWEARGDECAYYVSSEKFNGGAHRFISEKTVFARWAVASNMTFHAPKWDPKDYAKAETSKSS
ncbi:alpha-N-acetylgalactosaminide alpha-2,6-sialyltransferase 3-like [Corticium candelabrum]|uniref:alpha-N-acetylgalactosaminide alpha-2,6-sialyltransferase 3-like n=1 Tax=Corticium candelabrum TaxID=121492 RepID=UPI002E326B85|nr:alpha-N-acetylgalactosaminide alpha-2,6-sialyltransferase 3-like [Corticium candelabrum]